MLFGSTAVVNVKLQESTCRCVWLLCFFLPRFLRSWYLSKQKQIKGVALSLVALLITQASLTLSLKGVEPSQCAALRKSGAR